MTMITLSIILLIVTTSAIIGVYIGVNFLQQQMDQVLRTHIDQVKLTNEAIKEMRHNQETIITMLQNITK